MRACRASLRGLDTQPCNLTGGRQLATIFVSLACLWWIIRATGGWSILFSAGLSALLGVVLVRAFVLMHDCGHGSLLRSPWGNRFFGTALGVLTGLPQAVWARRHEHHHRTNGDWDRYRGPLSVIPVLEYLRLSRWRRVHYRMARSIWLAPVGGFLYLVVFPRLNFLRASAALLGQAAGAWRHPAMGGCIRAVRDFHRPYCESIVDYRHMVVNNVVLVALWVAMARALGPALFVMCYAIAMAVAGSAAIILFSVQHNFAHAYASSTAAWNRDHAISRGTSFLVLPGWLNWVTADIAYHHVHHLCSGIPNYRLAACHAHQQDAFSPVTRLQLAELPGALKYILWDVAAQRLVCVAEVPS